MSSHKMYGDEIVQREKKGLVKNLTTKSVSLHFLQTTVTLAPSDDYMIAGDSTKTTFVRTRFLWQHDT